MFHRLFFLTTRYALNSVRFRRRKYLFPVYVLYQPCDALIDILSRNFVNRRFSGVYSSSRCYLPIVNLQALVLNATSTNNGTYVMFAGVSRGNTTRR